jgi:anoctamin-10
LKERFLSGVGVGLEEVAGVGSYPTAGGGDRDANETEPNPKGFWDHDEGVEEIQRIVKEV